VTENIIACIVCPTRLRSEASTTWDVLAVSANVNYEGRRRNLLAVESPYDHPLHHGDVGALRAATPTTRNGHNRFDVSQNRRLAICDWSDTLCDLFH